MLCKIRMFFHERQLVSKDLWQCKTMSVRLNVCVILVENVQYILMLLEYTTAEQSVRLWSISVRSKGFTVIKT